MNRCGKLYKAYLDGALGVPSANRIPYSTLRRWRLQGKINNAHLQQLGLKTRRRRGPLTQPEQPAQDRGNHEAVPCSSQSAQDTNYDDGSSASQTSQHSLYAASSDSSDSEEVNLSPNEVMEYSESVNSDNSSTLDSSDAYSVSSFSDDESQHDESMLGLSSVMKSKFIGPDPLSLPLHPALAITKFETLLAILHIYMRHHTNEVLLEDLLKLVNLIVGIPDALPKTKFLFHKLFMSGSSMEMHFYCPACRIYAGPEKAFSEGEVFCKKCDWSSTVSSHNGGHYFLSLSLKEQIKDILNKPGVKLVQKPRRNDDIISDVMDAFAYKSWSREGKILSSLDALTLTFNTDGAPVFENGNNSLWPVHFLINEIDPTQRFNADHILLGGLWFGKCEPNIQVFLEPFVDELKELQNTGVNWKKADGTVVKSPVYGVFCCTDSVAKPKVQCHMQFNGAFSCSYCLHPNNSITVVEKVDNRRMVVRNRGGRGAENGDQPEVFREKTLMRFTRGEHPLRSNRELRAQMKLAADSPYDHIMGSTGISVLCKLKYFDVVFGFPIDYMHAVLLGTVRRMVGYWLDSTNHSFPYYIGTSINRLDKRISTITLPSGFRPPQPLSDRVHWKANQWRAFLFYFGLPVLAGILPSAYYNHFKQLVIAVYTLTKESILHSEVDDAHNLLQDFVWDYQDLYGETNMVYNVHITGHLAQIVAKDGPLWAYSAFPFESANGRLLKLTTGTKGVATQIGRKYLMTKGVGKLLRNGYRARENIIKFCCEVIQYKYLKHASRGENNETLLGRERFHSLNYAQRQLFMDKGYNGIDFVLAFNRVIIDGRLYHSRLTTKQKKACDSCVRLKTGEFALIDLAFKNPKLDGILTDVVLLVTKLNIAADTSTLLVPHIKQCSLDSFGNMDLISSNDISAKCIYFSCDDNTYVSEFSNCYETD